MFYITNDSGQITDWELVGITTSCIALPTALPSGKGTSAQGTSTPPGITDTSSSTSSIGGGLSLGGTIGLAAGITLGFIVVFVCLLIFWHKRRNPNVAGDAKPGHHFQQAYRKTYGVRMYIQQTCALKNLYHTNWR
jgi:hypothetical protein